MPIALDLFAGAGGLAEGLEAAGFQIVAAVELHPQPALTHAFNHPHTKVLVGDIQQLSMDLLKDRIERVVGKQPVDLVVGGPPCQGFSTAGKKREADPRNNLFSEFVRVVAHFRPRMFLLENVPGFKKMYQGQIYNQAIALFNKLGYQLTDTVLNASTFGIPQRRQRFIMIGWLPGEVLPFEWPDEVLASPGQPSLFAMDMVTVADALDDIAFLEPGWESHKHQREALSDFQRDRRNGCASLFNHLATRHRAKAAMMFDHIAEGATISSVPEYLKSGKRTMARLNRYALSNAVLALPDDLIHYCHSRIPTVREMARLQSFDDDYVFFGKRTSGFIERRVDVPQYTQVGNAVPPLLGRGLGKALMTSFHLPTKDIREIVTRRERHQWVRGSSGFSGYTLDLAATAEIIIENIKGEILPLPISTEDRSTVEADALYEWWNQSNPRRGQWAPGVVAD